jgi:hypothetical protein
MDALTYKGTMKQKQVSGCNAGKKRKKEKEKEKGKKKKPDLANTMGIKKDISNLFLGNLSRLEHVQLLLKNKPELVKVLHCVGSQLRCPPRTTFPN